MWDTLPTLSRPPIRVERHGAHVNAICRGTVSMLDHARNRHNTAQEKLLLEHGARTAAELKEQQPAAPPKGEPERPAKAA